VNDFNEIIVHLGRGSLGLKFRAIVTANTIEREVTPRDQAMKPPRENLWVAGLGGCG
jgi:hypothetical protein